MDIRNGSFARRRDPPILDARWGQWHCADPDHELPVAVATVRGVAGKRFRTGSRASIRSAGDGKVSRFRLAMAERTSNVAASGCANACIRW